MNGSKSAIKLLADELDQQLPELSQGQRAKVFEALRKAMRIYGEQVKILRHVGQEPLDDGMHGTGKWHPGTEKPVNLKIAEKLLKRSVFVEVQP